MDKGLIWFAKFAGAVLAIFVVVGVYLFGFNLDEASDKVSEAKIEVQIALLEIAQERAKIDSTLHDIEVSVRHVEALKLEIAGHRKDAESSAAEVRQLVADLGSYREEADRIIVGLRALDPSETIVALTRREERRIGADRGKLWNIGTILQFHFLDGEEPEKDIVRAAIRQWAEHVNLTFTETSSPEAEIRISFNQAGSWSFVGTDALGIPRGKPTLNYGFLAQLKDRKAAMQTALHEFGHLLGLAHEFQNPSAGEIFDRKATLTYYMGAPNFWSEEQVIANVLGKVEYPGSREYDPSSIMNYTFSQELFMPGKETHPGNELSASDKAYVGLLYPKD